MKIKLKNLGRIGGSLEAAVGISTVPYLLNFDYSKLYNYLIDGPMENKLLSAFVGIFAIGLPTILGSSLLIDGSVDLTKGTHHSLYAWVCKKFAKSEETREYFKNYTNKMLKLREDVIEL